MKRIAGKVLFGLAIAALGTSVALVAGCGDGANGPRAAAIHAPAVTVAKGAAYDAKITGREVLTPPHGNAPRINAPAVYGCRPGRPMIYRIPTTGKRPIEFAAENLPASIRLEAKSGILIGTTPAKPGTYTVTFHAGNAHGRDTARLDLVVGDKLALTPPMGWNSWYTHYQTINDAKTRAAADAMVASGMADVGYSYVSLDDCWMRMDPNRVPELMKRLGKNAAKVLDVKVKAGPTRANDGQILPARDFPDMKALTDHIHAYGLKAGIYTSPGPQTCARFEGSYGHEAQDARTFADWGFDLLKYDWCSYSAVYGKRMKEFNNDPNKVLPEHKRPYEIMGPTLAGLGRDIELNLCQYGMSEVWKWGAEVAGQSWRIGGDLGFTLTRGGVYRTAKKTIDLRKYNGPSRWNDPDYLILGNWVPDRSEPPQPVNLTPGEQYSYVSLWCMMACPMFFSGDMATVDAFTYGLLCNTEMIAVNQDRLGICAEPVVMDSNQWVLKKPMADGSVVVGLFNLEKDAGREIAITWTRLGLPGPAKARDLWRQRDVDFPSEVLTVKLGPQGCAVFKIRGR